MKDKLKTETDWARAVFEDAVDAATKEEAYVATYRLCDGLKPLVCSNILHSLYSDAYNLLFLRPYDATHVAAGLPLYIVLSGIRPTEVDQP